MNAANEPARVTGRIPNGIREQLPEIQTYTFCSTILGFILLTYTIVQKANEKVKMD